MSAVYGYRASSWDQRAGGFLYLRQCLYRDLRNCPNGGDHRAWQIPKRCAIARLSMTRQSHAHIPTKWCDMLRRPALSQ